jgi:hypothetical protein
VVDLCFDDRSWTVRYLAVDGSGWLPDRWVVISPISVRSWAAETQTQVKIELRTSNIHKLRRRDSEQMHDLPLHPSA